MRGKNTRCLLHWPLVQWTLAAAVGARRLDLVAVTTDDPDVAMMAKACAGVVVIDRPRDLAQDDTPDRPVVAHALNALGGPWRDDHALVMYLRPTAPFRTGLDIDRAAEWIATHGEVTSLRSVVPAPCHPRKAYRELPCTLPYTVLLPYTPHHAANEPRQGLEPVWQAAGWIDVVRARWVFLGSMEGPVVAAWRVSPERAVDLDTEEQWTRAEALAAERGWRPGELLGHDGHV